MRSAPQPPGVGPAVMLACAEHQAGEPCAQRHLRMVARSGPEQVAARLLDGVLGVARRAERAARLREPLRQQARDHGAEPISIPRRPGCAEGLAQTCVRALAGHLCDGHGCAHSISLPQRRSTLRGEVRIDCDGHAMPCRVQPHHQPVGATAVSTCGRSARKLLGYGLTPCWDSLHTPSTRRSGATGQPREERTLRPPPAR